jgi:hypothetical protein
MPQHRDAGFCDRELGDGAAEDLADAAIGRGAAGLLLPDRP